MGFLEGIGATITQKSNEMASKTRDMVDATSMSGTISRLNKNLALQYQAIGEKYYNAHKNDEDAEFSEDIAAINAVFAEIDTLQGKIEGLKQAPASAAPANEAVQFCTACGAKVTPGSAFCTSCGAKL